MFYSSFRSVKCRKLPPWLQLLTSGIKVYLFYSMLIIRILNYILRLHWSVCNNFESIVVFVHNFKFNKIDRIFAAQKVCFGTFCLFLALCELMFWSFRAQFDRMSETVNCISDWPSRFNFEWSVKWCGVWMKRLFWTKFCKDLVVREKDFPAIRLYTRNSW